jgi:dihydrofolate reductase
VNEKMVISLIAAMDEFRGIGVDNRLPWHLPADLKRFKSLTMGHHLIMGRKTFETIGKPLPGRKSIVVTHDRNYTASGCPEDTCHVVHSLEEALDIAESMGESEVFVIGGGEIFDQALRYADRLYLTLVHTKANTNVFFPEIDESAWVEIHSSYQPADQNNPFAFTFRDLVRE